MANRRLGVEHVVAQYEVRGTKDLPAPDSLAPGPEESENGIQEYRPDFRSDGVQSDEVGEYLGAVVEDVIGEWDNSEPDVDRKKVSLSKHDNR